MYGSYKAERLKAFALYFSVPLMHGICTSRSLENPSMMRLELRSSFRKVLFIALDHSLHRKDVYNMRLLIQKFHALYSSIFHIDERHHHCFTPSTHAILYLSEILDECRPLPNASQFLTEPTVGEISKTANTARNLETHLLNQDLHRFAIRMEYGGIRRRFNSNPDGNQDESAGHSIFEVNETVELNDTEIDDNVDMDMNENYSSEEDLKDSKTDWTYAGLLKVVEPSSITQYLREVIYSEPNLTEDQPKISSVSIL